MSENLERFQRDFLHANTWAQRKDGVPLDLLDVLSAEERQQAEDALIEAADDKDAWPVRGLGHLCSTKALPVLYTLLEKCQLAMKINVAFAIYQINRDDRMVEVVLDEFPNISNEYALIETFHLLPIFPDSRIKMLLEHSGQAIPGRVQCHGSTRATDQWRRPAFSRKREKEALVAAMVWVDKEPFLTGFQN